jgi:hypothetical protein
MLKSNISTRIKNKINVEEPISRVGSKIINKNLRPNLNNHRKTLALTYL